MAVAFDSSRREVSVWSSAADLLALYNSKFNFQFAKSVMGKNGEITYNIVWQSKNLAPRFGIAWEPIYALNWTLGIPTGGLTVTLGGVWQTCALGQSFDLSPIGLWVPTTPDPTSPPKPNFMNVGKNNYSYPGQNGIHIVVGVKNSAGGYDVIYVDPTELGLNMSSWYQPQETVKWWYQTGTRTSTIIAGADTPIQTYDISAPNPETGLFFVSTTYIYSTGQWINSPNAPPIVLETGVLGTPGAPQSSGGRGAGKTNGSTKEPAATDSNTQSSVGGQKLEDKIISVEKALLRLTALLSTGGAHVQLAPYRGTIIWPGLTQRAVMLAGANLAANYLSSLGYIASAFLEENTSTTYVDFFEVGSPPNGGVPLPVMVDWADAFTAVVPDSGQRNGGIQDMGPQGKAADKAADSSATDAAAPAGDTMQIRKAQARAIAAANGA